MSITCAACGRVLRKGAGRCIFCEEKKYLEEVANGVLPLTRAERKRAVRDEKIQAKSQVELNDIKSWSEKADVLRATEESAEAARIKGFPFPDIKNPSDTQSSTFRFCHLCGEELLNNSKFCSSCGAQIPFEIVTQVPMSADYQPLSYWSPPTPKAKDYFRSASRFMVWVVILLILVVLSPKIFESIGSSSSGGGNSSSSSGGGNSSSSSGGGNSSSSSGGGNSSSSSGDWDSGTADKVVDKKSNAYKTMFNVGKNFARVSMASDTAKSQCNSARVSGVIRNNGIPQYLGDQARMLQSYLATASGFRGCLDGFGY
jgi:uncharacterized membrane protein YgcG